MGLYDRDYMRQPKGKNDRYWKWLHGPDFTGAAEPGPKRRPTGARRASQSRSHWNQRVTATQAAFGIALGVALIVLSHMTIAGRHWHVWFFPI
jgi:hypothetical protein